MAVGTRFQHGLSTTSTRPVAGQVLTNTLTANGLVTLNGAVALSATNGITAFATGGQTSATQLTTSFNRITTCASAGDSVKLPASVAGYLIIVQNDGAAYANIFPFSGDQIGSLAANTAISIAPGGRITFNCEVAGRWDQAGNGMPAAQFLSNTTTTAFLAGQLTGANYVTYMNTQGTPGSIQVRTAAQFFTDNPYARVGATYNLRIVNAQGTGTLTVTTNTGITLTGTMTIAINSWRDFVVTYTSASAVVVQSTATGTYS